MLWCFRKTYRKFFTNYKKNGNSYPKCAQYTLNDEYYKKIEAIQFTMDHDDGNSLDDIEKGSFTEALALLI